MTTSCGCATWPEVFAVVMAAVRDITGSTSVVEELQAHDLVDQYRLILFPTAVGQGRRMIPTGDLELANCERLGPAVRLTYDRIPA